MRSARATAAGAAQGLASHDPDTRVGSIEVVVPKLRYGTYLPEWLPARRKEPRLLITALARCLPAGVGTRRMDKLVQTLGIDAEQATGVPHGC